MKTLLVLEGGGLRGIYTAGVLDILMENNIKVDTIIGVSAGALFGVNYVSNQKGRALRYNLENAGKKEYMGFRSWLKTGDIVNKEYCYNKLIYELDPMDFETYKKSKTEFYATVTNLNTGRAEYIKINDLEKDIEYLRASGSMPFVSKIVKIDNKKYLDGGISDAVPIKWGLKNGYKRIVVVETRPNTYRKKKKPVWPIKLLYRKYPRFVETFKNRYKNYNKTKEYIKNLEKDNRIFVIRPSKLVKIKRLETNKDKIQKMYNLGVEDISNKLKDLERYLKNEKM